MTESPQSERVEVEESNEEKNLFVVDPGDYQETKELEIIHSTKQEVLNVRNNRSHLILEFGYEFQGTGVDIYQRVLAQTIAQYGSELLPLIEEAVENGTLEEDDLVIPLVSEPMEVNITTFVEADGHIEAMIDDRESTPEPDSLAVYRQLRRIQRKLGLGLELQEQKGPANI